MLKNKINTKLITNQCLEKLIFFFKFLKEINKMSMFPIFRRRNQRFQKNKNNYNSVKPFQYNENNRESDEVALQLLSELYPNENFTMDFLYNRKLNL